MEAASLILNYIIIPFISAVGLCLVGFKIYNKISYYSIQKHHFDLKILELENQLREQKDKSSILSDQIETISLRTQGINKRLDEIIVSVKRLDENILQKTHSTSPFPVVSSLSSYVSESNKTTSQSDYGETSQPQLQSFNKEEERQNSTIEYILKKLEDSSLTTREIQKIVGRTREHTSRIMKKLFDNNYVKRDIHTKPYRYSITDEGRRLLTRHSVSKNPPLHSDPQHSESRLSDLIEK